MTGIKIFFIWIVLFPLAVISFLFGVFISLFHVIQELLSLPLNVHREISSWYAVEVNEE